MDPITDKPAVPPAEGEKPAAAPAAAPEATPAASAAGEAPIAPTAAVETPKADDKKEGEGEGEKKEEDKKEASFRIRFAQGKTFEDSYFIAEDKGEFRAVKASRIIPVPVQEKIIKTIAATGKPPEDVVTPSEIIEQMTGQGVNSLESFETAATQLETSASKMVKKAGMMAWNESEVPAPAKAGEKPLMAVQESEMEAGKKLQPLPNGVHSPVKQYYGRLPSSSGIGGAPNVAINPQSSTNVKDKIDFMRRALEEMKAQKDAAEDKAKKAEDKASMLEKKDEDKESSSLLESIVKDLLAKKLITDKDEQAAISALAKVERKSLAAVASLLKLLGKTEKSDAGMEAKPSPFGGAPKPAPVAPGAEKQPKASMTLPPSFLSENEPDAGNGQAFLAKYWDAK